MNPYRMEDGPVYWHYEGFTIAQISMMLHMPEADVKKAILKEWRKSK